jgi:hypothetical protein
MDALRAAPPPPLRVLRFDFAVVVFLLLAEADFDLLEALPLLRFAIVDFFELDFFAPPPPLLFFFIPPPLFVLARFFVPAADFAMNNPPSGDVGHNTITRDLARMRGIRDIFPRAAAARVTTRGFPGGAGGRRRIESAQGSVNPSTRG